MVNNVVIKTKNLKVSFKEIENTSKYNWLNPINSSDIFVGDKCIGYISVLNLGIKNAIDKKLNVVLVEIYVDALNELEYNEIKVNDVSKYQTVTFDLSFLVENTVKFEVLKNIIDNTSLDNLQKYALVDIFEDSEKLGDKKSVTIRFTLCSDEHTLTTEEITKDRERLLEAFKNNGIFIRE